jgi:hypothetical protein
MRSDFETIILDACPFCGVAQWTGYVACVRCALGDYFTCRLCGAHIWEGTLIKRGEHLNPDTVTRVVRLAFPSVPMTEPAYIAPEHRRICVNFERSVAWL